VDEVIARLRHSIPGVGSDFAAASPRHLFHRRSRATDLRPEERKSASPHRVKLVAEVGVGTVAAGVAKAHADVVLISGDSGARELHR